MNGVFYEDDFVYCIVIEFWMVLVGVEFDIVVVLDNLIGFGDVVVVFEDIVLDNGGIYIVIVNGVVGNIDMFFILVINVNV